MDERGVEMGIKKDAVPVINEFSKFLENFRENRGWTKKETAKHLGCTEGHVRLAEEGLIEYPFSILVSLYVFLTKSEKEELAKLVTDYNIERLKTGTVKRSEKK